MRICVVGAGAIGGMMGVMLHKSGQDVTLIARGAHLEAIQTHGLKLRMSDGTEHVAAGVMATSDMRTVGIQDMVIIGLKAHQIEPVVDDIASMIGPETIVLTTQNGIPWWYFQKIDSDYAGTVVRSVDPNGVLASKIDSDRIVGCIAYPAAEISEPGVIKHIEGVRFPVGELDNSVSERATEIADMLNRAELKSYVLEDIRSEIWLKLWGNLSFNPISALTHATLADICEFEASRDLAKQMMLEAQTIAEKLGASFRVSLEKRVAGAHSVGKHKTSMLQDVEQGKPLEIKAIIGAAKELGKLTWTPTPAINAVNALICLLDNVMRTEDVAIKAESREPQPNPKTGSVAAIAIAANG